MGMRLIGENVLQAAGYSYHWNFPNHSISPIDLIALPGRPPADAPPNSLLRHFARLIANGVGDPQSTPSQAVVASGGSILAFSSEM